MSLLKRLRQDQSGAATVLLAVASPALIGASALAVDLGSMYLAERQLQGVADAAAAAAVSGSDDAEARAAAEAVIAANGVQKVTIADLQSGTYSRDSTIAIDKRFQPGGSTTNAVQVSLVQDVPLFFGAFFTGTHSNQVHAKATAARQDIIAFDIGSALIAGSGGLQNKILSGLAGTPLDLSDDAISALASSPIDVITFADQLRRLQEQPRSTFGQTFDRSTDIALAVRAMAASTNDAATRDALLSISYALQAAPVTVSDIIELGPFRDLDVNDGRKHALVDAYSLLRNLLQSAHPEGYDFTISAAAAGLTNVSVRVAGGHGHERSPWLTLTSAYGVILRTAETRLAVNASLSTGVGSVRIPIYAELAAAEARVSSVDCAPVADDQTADLGVTPSLGEIALADLASDNFADLTSDMEFKKARIVDTALVKVDALSDLSLGGSTEQLAHFTRADIDEGVRKVVGSNDLAQTAAASLSDDVTLNATVAGLGLGSTASTVTSVVGTALSAVAPTIDALITQVTNSLGVKLGAADVGVITLRCGRPLVVA